MVDTGSPGSNGGSSRPLILRLRPSAARRTNGILDARVKKLSANQCPVGRAMGRARCAHDCKCHSLGSRLRAELMSLATRPQGEPIAFTLDSFTFAPADAAQVALFFNTFGSLYHIRKFTIGKNVVKLDTPEQIRPYVIAIENLPLLEEISFSGTSMGIWAAYSLAVALRSKKRLRRADFSNCFTSRGSSEIAPAMDALVSALLELPNLEDVSLAHNAFGPEVEWPFLRLVRGLTPVRDLDITNMGIGPEVGVNLAKALVTLSENKAKASGAAPAGAGAGEAAAPPLRSLLSSRNRYIQDSDAPLFGMAEWAAAFAAHPGLRKVNFGVNGVRFAGMDVLVSEGLARLHALEELDLGDNFVAERGVERGALAAAALGWPELRVLNLNDGYLGSRGGALLIAALAQTQQRQPGGSKLEVLKVVGCNLNGANTLALAAAMEKGLLPRLRKVAISLNNFAKDDPGVAALTRLLAEREMERERERGVETAIEKVIGTVIDSELVEEEPNSQPSVEEPDV